MRRSRIITKAATPLIKMMINDSTPATTDVIQFPHEVASPAVFVQQVNVLTIQMREGGEWKSMQSVHNHHGVGEREMD